MKRLEGIFTAVITPFNAKVVDYDAFSKFIEWQIQQGVNGLVICGTTAEAHSLTEEEYNNLINLTIKINNNRVPIIVGVPSNSTYKVISIINKIKNNSIAAFLVSTPYYLKPTQQGIMQHFKEISKNCNSQIVAYNVPSRCGVEIEDETMIEIMKLQNIIAIKDATGNLEKPLIYRKYNKEISLLSGDDTTYLHFMLNGGNGCISVASNVLPKLLCDLHKLISVDIKKACRINTEIFPFIKSLFCQTNPMPVKYALSLVKEYISKEVRLPLTEVEEDGKKTIKENLSRIENYIF